MRAKRRWRQIGGLLAALALFLGIVTGCGRALPNTAGQPTAASKPGVGQAVGAGDGPERYMVEEKPAAPGAFSRPQAGVAGGIAAGEAAPQGGPVAAAQVSAGRGADAAPQSPARGAVLPPSGTRLTQQRIIKNAELSLEVKDVPSAIRDVELAAEERFGVVTDSQLSGSGQGDRANRRATLTVRVPSDQFAAFLARVQELGKLLAHRIYTEDVSGQFVDLEARQKSALQHEQRLQQILARAGTVEELLRLESELNRVRAEIESITGRLNLLKDRVEYSTVRLTLVEAGIGSGRPPQPKTTWQQATEAFVAGAKAVGAFAASLVVFGFGIAPAAFAVGVLALLLLPLARRLRPRSPKPAAVGPPASVRRAGDDA